jgi:hypothetical protein
MCVFAQIQAINTSHAGCTRRPWRRDSSSQISAASSTAATVSGRTCVRPR